MRDSLAAHTTDVAVRWSDFDRFGHLNNGAYIELAQEARNIFAIEEFLGRGLEVPAVFLRTLEVDYRKPILPDTTAVTVSTTVTHVGKTSFTTRQEIADRDGVHCATVTCVQIAVDVKTASPRAITASELRVLAPGRVNPDGEIVRVDEGSSPAGATDTQ
ncbi:acyl-CoA thioesterase [Corynebacterium choanae]|uniref:Thioesterase superfamily protein n=1 Tax=Corynebacterium choanae TaxID=1862358 RepID=A0A3G6JBV2_9CORY|nr:acyl-CoA thioesterase [Corynebacterium choanae]AZA14150.1 Thioesterase superfamily protein [Corynebacterium choanae]